MVIVPITGIKRQVLISGCMYIGQMIAGFSIGFTGPVIPKLRDPEQSPLPYMLSETEISLIGSLLYIGTIPGPYLMGWISNKRGRKICLIIGGLIGILAYLILATTSNLAMLYSGRLLSGCGCGIIIVMNVVYIGEMASTKIRGILLTVLGIFHTLGTILVYAVGPYVSYSATCYVGVGIAAVYTCAVCFLPETPLFYALRGDEKNVRKVLEDLGRLEVIDKIADAKKEIITTSTKDWIELIKLKSNRRALFIVVTINIFQQLSGVLAVVFFSASIFEMAGSSISSHVSMIIIGCCQLCGSFLTPLLVERSGRKFILMVSSAMCSLSMLVFGLYFYLDHIDYSGINDIGWLPLVILIIFFTSFDLDCYFHSDRVTTRQLFWDIIAIAFVYHLITKVTAGGVKKSFGIIPNTIIGEMFTINVRSTGSAVAMSSSWLAGFGITTVFGTVVEAFGPHVIFWFFSSTCACACVFTLLFIPETKGKTLLEIQDLLGKQLTFIRTV